MCFGRVSPASGKRETGGQNGENRFQHSLFKNPFKNGSSAAVGKNGNWFVLSLDEGLFGMFRYQQSWFDLAKKYLDFSNGAPPR